MNDMARQIARWVALAALFLLPFTPLIVANGYFFPFITGKTFYLRTLIEIAVAGWVVLAFLDKEYRPRFSWIGVSVIGFVAWMFVADAFALNATKAFWSNFERMEGWVLLVHLLGLFFASSAVLRVEKKWRAWFLTSIGVSAIIVGYALLQLNGAFAIHQGSSRIDATLGNSAYLAIYLLFSTFVALWLALTEDRPWLKWLLIALATIEGVLIFFTETRGTIIGLVLALSLVAVLTAITAGGRARRAAVWACVFIILIVGGFYLARDSDFVQNNHVLQRIASISINDGQTRFTIWGMALKGTLERPLTGYGQEGFNYVFNKFYDPSLFKQEQWFDRAHNAFIDWLTAGGIPAFILYVSLFGSAIVLLWKRSELSRPERIMLTATLVGYAVHNVFVFDNLYSYIYFFAILALIDSQISRPIERLERTGVLSSEDGATYALPIASVALIAMIWYVNITGMQTSSKLIIAISPHDNLSKNIETFQYLAEHPSFATQEIREQMISFLAAIARNQSVTDEQKQKMAALTISEAQKQTTDYPLDARAHLQLSYAYRIVGNVAGALDEVKIASQLSPKKEQFLIEKGVIEWEAGNFKEAQGDFNSAYALGPQFPELAMYSAVGNITAGNQGEASRILISAFGTENVDSDILSTAYYRAMDWVRLINFWKLRAEKPGASAETLFSLASAYYVSGDKENAIRTINKAVEIYPNVAANGAEAIKQIEGK
jgi:O-antigen ligase/tetratricopeptide (TPR) repeat protein